MDLARLTRPAILCQCLRCSSSLAALENEWAKLSNSYSIAAGWLSVELHRISISADKKQIPQSSDLSIIRGRIIQEISCKLCQQKLGVLCALDNGPNIFWKLSKVSFREIVTMRTVEPSFKDGLLERIIPDPATIPERTPMPSGALVPAGSTEVDGSVGSVEQQMQHQGRSLNHISNSVSNLHDTMFELKQSFTALRIELNDPSRFPSEITVSNGTDFNMITTVLKELKLKSEEIERLKLEIEALKLKNRFMEEQAAKHTTQPSTMEDTLPEVATPGLLQGSRKRPFPFPDYFPTGRSQPIADSFEDENDEDSMADFSLDDASLPPVRIPLKDSEAMQPYDTPTASPPLRIEVHQPTHHNNTSRPDTGVHQQAIVKRRRLSHSTENPPANGGSEKKTRGRPRKSIGQAANPETPSSLTPKPTPLGEQAGNAGGNNQKEPSSANATPIEQKKPTENRPGRPRTLRSRSRPPSRARESEPMPDAGNNQLEHERTGSNLQVQQTDSGKENGEYKSGMNEKRKALTAARDIMAKLAMQREEAMDTEESR